MIQHQYMTQQPLGTGQCDRSYLRTVLTAIGRYPGIRANLSLRIGMRFCLKSGKAVRQEKSRETWWFTFPCQVEFTALKVSPFSLLVDALKPFWTLDRIPVWGTNYLELESEFPENGSAVLKGISAFGPHSRLGDKQLDIRGMVYNMSFFCTVQW